MVPSLQAKDIPTVASKRKTKKVALLMRMECTSAVIDPKNTRLSLNTGRHFRDTCGLLGDVKGAYPFSTERQKLLSRLALEALPYLDLDVEHISIRSNIHDTTYEKNKKVYYDLGWHENVPNRLMAIDLPTFI